MKLDLPKEFSKGIIMRTKLMKWVLPVLLLMTEISVWAQTTPIGTDVPVASSVSITDSLPQKRNFFKKFLDYFNDANKERTNKKFDFSVIGIIPVIPSWVSAW